jgi:outer membrane protein assembly factor BamE (lipoprotein component of BamABCDE complex)
VVAFSAMAAPAHPSIRVLALAFVATLMATGCSFGRITVNEPLDPRAVSGLVPGESTAADVVELLGAPSDVVPLGRRSAYRYDAESTKAAAFLMIVVNLGNVDRRSDRVWVFFDEDDVLTHVAATFAMGRTRYGFPWTDVHRNVKKEHAERHAAHDAAAASQGSEGG